MHERSHAIISLADQACILFIKPQTWEKQFSIQCKCVSYSMMPIILQKYHNCSEYNALLFWDRFVSLSMHERVNFSSCFVLCAIVTPSLLERGTSWLWWSIIQIDSSPPITIHSFYYSGTWSLSTVGHCMTDCYSALFLIKLANTSLQVSMVRQILTHTHHSAQTPKSNLSTNSVSLQTDWF